MLSFQKPKPVLLIGSVQFRLGHFSKLQQNGSKGLLHGQTLALRFELLGGILADRIQHQKALLAVNLLLLDEVLVHERGEPIQYMQFRPGPRGSTHLFGRTQRTPAGKHR